MSKVVATRRTVKPRAAKPRAARPDGILETVKTVIYAGLIALAVRSFLFEPFNIPSGSMFPTLQVGDFLFVSKFTYGFSRFSLPFAPHLWSGRIFSHTPHRGDVAVFREPTDTSTDFIKRIIGLPGDHIQMRSGHLFLNNVEVPRRLVGDYTTSGDGSPEVLQRYIETLPNGVHHSILKETDETEQTEQRLAAANNTQEYVVPPNFVFCMGDNRDNSLDSRFLDYVGYVPMENLIGPAQFIFFSFDAEHPWWQFWYWPAEVRWNRLFRPVR